MRKTIPILLLGIALNAPAYALKALYLGGRAGAMAFSNFQYGSNTAFGYGLDLGLWLIEPLELLAQFQTSQHHTTTSPLSEVSQFLSLELHPFELQEINLSAGIGIGKVWMTYGTNKESDWALSGGLITDFLVNPTFSIGVMAKMFAPLHNTIGSSFWGAMLRAGWRIHLDERGERIYIR